MDWEIWAIKDKRTGPRGHGDYWAGEHKNANDPVNNGMLFSHKKRENGTICDNMGGSWECHAWQNKSDGKRQESYDFTRM